MHSIYTISFHTIKDKKCQLNVLNKRIGTKKYLYSHFQLEISEFKKMLIRYNMKGGTYVTLSYLNFFILTVLLKKNDIRPLLILM